MRAVVGWFSTRMITILIAHVARQVPMIRAVAATAVAVAMVDVADAVVVAAIKLMIT